MSSTAYGVYTNNGSVDTEVLTEDIQDGLVDYEKGARVAFLLVRAIDRYSLPVGSTWVVQATAQQRT